MAAEVGVRQLKSSLSKYLKRVQSGETIVVTDRGEPVARIIPVGFPEELGKLLAGGRVTWSGNQLRPPKLARVAPGPALSDYIAEDRG